MRRPSRSPNSSSTAGSSGPCRSAASARAGKPGVAVTVLRDIQAAVAVGAVVFEEVREILDVAQIVDSDDIELGMLKSEFEEGTPYSPKTIDCDARFCHMKIIANPS